MRLLPWEGCFARNNVWVFSSIGKEFLSPARGVVDCEQNEPFHLNKSLLLITKS